jgi:hypothetical protein
MIFVEKKNNTKKLSSMSRNPHRRIIDKIQKMINREIFEKDENKYEPKEIFIHLSG